MPICWIVKWPPSLDQNLFPQLALPQVILWSNFPLRSFRSAWGTPAPLWASTSVPGARSGTRQSVPGSWPSQTGCPAPCIKTDLEKKLSKSKPSSPTLWSLAPSQHCPCLHDPNPSPMTWGFFRYSIPILRRDLLWQTKCQMRLICLQVYTTSN